MSNITHAAAVLIALAGSASATIVSSTGMTTVLPLPPASCVPFALMGPTAFAWNEQQGVAANNVLADMTTNPSSAPGGAVPGLVSGTFDSHFVHVHSPGQFFVGGSVTFNNPIVAVLYKNVPLDLSDGTFGALGTAYPTGNASRAWTQMFGVSVSFKTFKFALHFSPMVGDIEQFRILTQTPAPGSLALMGAAGVIATRRRRSGD